MRSLSGVECPLLAFRLHRSCPASIAIGADRPSSRAGTRDDSQRFPRKNALTGPLGLSATGGLPGGPSVPEF
jgi:hypothetical protein